MSDDDHTVELRPVGAGATLDLLDRPGPPRAGEALDLPALAAYLDATLGDVRPITVAQFPGGHSNLTYLVTRGDGDGAAEYVLRRPPVGAQIKSAHDMGREHRVLTALAPHLARAPRPIALCADPGVLGAPFYLMERRRGVILRKELPPGLALDHASARRLSTATVDTLVELHGIDVTRPELAALGKPAGYVGRQITGWTERYGAARTDDLPVVEQVARWLAATQPGDGAPALIHNDFKIDNLVLTPDLHKVEAVLDWEMATLGDPLMDLGTTLAYWVEATDPAPLVALRFGMTHLPGMMSRREVAERYAARSGRAVDDVVFYYAFGLFKVAVVAQQIYARYAQGLTADPRFAAFIHAVRALAEQARAAIERGRL